MRQTNRQEPADSMNTIRIARANCGDHFGYIDEFGHWLIKPRYMEASDFGESGIAAVKEASANWRLIRADGKMHAEVQRPVDELLAPSEGLIPFRARNRWGFLDTNGRTTIENRFLRRVASDDTADLLRFSGGQAAVGYPIVDVEYGDSLVAIGLIATPGNWLIEASASAISYGEGSLVFDCRHYPEIGDPPWGFDFRPLGRVSGPELRVPFAQADKVRSSQNGLIPFGRVPGKPKDDLQYFGADISEKNLNWGLLNWRGEVVVNAKFDDVRPLGPGLFGTESDSEWKIWTLDSKAISAPDLLDIRPFSCGLASAKAQNGLWGFIDQQGSWRIEPQFTDCGPFVESHR
jgi:hypothetical protein